MLNSIKGKAAISGSDGKFSIEEIEVFPPKAGEVLVKLMAAGLCHTDYDSLSWKAPLILGHEGAGIVEAVGEGVTSVKPGDKVILNWGIPCGTCYQCIQKNQNICENNSPVTSGDQYNGTPLSGGHVPVERTLYRSEGIRRSFNLGTLSTHTVVREHAVVKIDIEIPFSSASIIGCGVVTGYGSAVNVAEVKPGSSVVVLGTGGVGLNVIQGARIAGADKIIAVDINLSRLEMAKQFGATHIVQTTKEDIEFKEAKKQVLALTGGRGADYAFECTAIPALGAAPLHLIRNGGTAVQVSGIDDTIPFDMKLFQWDKVYINPLYGKCRPQIDFPILLNLYKKKSLLLDEMVTKTYALEQLADAFKDMHEGKIAKGVILFENN
jgi:S-(hydroxymethyl)glutathione dehydrogenase/alcohol dehydrogenase